MDTEVNLVYLYCYKILHKIQYRNTGAIYGSSRLNRMLTSISCTITLEHLSFSH